jgi:hypothetical protein
MCSSSTSKPASARVRAVSTYAAVIGQVALGRGVHHLHRERAGIRLR